MRYMQMTVSDKEFVIIKKAAIDAGLSLNKFLKLAVFKLILDSDQNNSLNTKTKEV